MRCACDFSKPRDHMILPDVISKEPLGPVVRGNDRQWIDIVEWVHFAMLNAEELGVSTRGNDVGESRRFCVSSAIPQISAGRSELSNAWAVKWSAKGCQRIETACDGELR